MANGVSKQTAAELLEHEFAQERASALGRLGRQARGCARRTLRVRRRKPARSAVERTAADPGVACGGSKHCALVLRRATGGVWAARSALGAARLSGTARNSRHHGRAAGDAGEVAQAPGLLNWAFVRVNRRESGANCSICGTLRATRGRKAIRAVVMQGECRPSCATVLLPARAHNQRKHA